MKNINWQGNRGVIHNLLENGLHMMTGNIQDIIEEKQTLETTMVEFTITATRHIYI